MREPDSSPLVSVVVIAYNQRDFAPLAIKSVLSQSYQNLECIFVDDGSTDETIERATDLSSLDGRLTVHRKPNGGPSSARNFGAARTHALSRFIAFLDGDDLYRPEFIEICLTYLQEHPDAGVVLPGHEFIDEVGASLEGRRRGYRWAPSRLWLPRRLQASEPVTPFITFYCGTGSAPFWMARLSDYRRTDGWDEALWPHEDTDMLCQLAMITEVHAIEPRLVQYRVHPKQITSLDPAQKPHVSTGSLSELQEKWNQRRYDGAHGREQNRILDRACVYYRQIHLPLRALWVARRALTDVARAPSQRSVARLFQLIGHFLRDFFYFKILFWRSRRHYASTRFYESNGAGKSFPTGRL